MTPHVTPRHTSSGGQKTWWHAFSRTLTGYIARGRTDQMHSVRSIDNLTGLRKDRWDEFRLQRTKYSRFFYVQYLNTKHSQNILWSHSGSMSHANIHFWWGNLSTHAHPYIVVLCMLISKVFKSFYSNDRSNSSSSRPLLSAHVSSETVHTLLQATNVIHLLQTSTRETRITFTVHCRADKTEITDMTSSTSTSTCTGATVLKPVELVLYK